MKWNLKKNGGVAAPVAGVNGSSQSRAFICREHRQMPLFFSKERGAKATTNRVSVRFVCLHVKRRGRRDTSKQGGGGCFRNPVWEEGEASPTQNALPHSLQPTQVFRSITSFSQLVILSLHQSSTAILSPEKRDLMWSSSRSLIAAVQTLPHTASIRRISNSSRAECHHLGSWMKSWLNVAAENSWSWIRAHPPFFQSPIEESKHLFLTRREKLLPHVCPSTHVWTDVEYRRCLKAVFIFGRLKKTKPSISNPNPLLLLLLYWSSILP